MQRGCPETQFPGSLFAFFWMSSSLKFGSRILQLRPFTLKLAKKACLRSIFRRTAMKRIYLIPAVLTFILAFGLSAFGAVSVDSLLTTQVNASPLSLTPVVITFDHRVG